MARSDSALDKGMALFLVKTILIAILAADSRNPASKILASLD
jgi:hypothetical protein